MSDNDKALDYYKNGVKGIPPRFVPSKVVLLKVVHGDGPFFSTRAWAGEYECDSNRFGAVSVKAENGKLLGLKPDEFEVTEWKENDKR